MSRLAWLPEPVQAYDGIPPDVEVDVYTGAPDDPVPDSLDRVAFYAVPYMMGPGTAEILARMPALEVVQAPYAGIELLKPHVRPGVTLCNARGVHDASTAELAMTLILSSLRGIPDFVRAMDDREWRHERLESLADKTVLILGYGSIGAALERRLEGFECSVVRVARSPRPDDGVSGISDLPSLLPSADVVVILMPLTSETQGLVDAKFLTAMKTGSLLVNVARGGIVDSAALLAELRTGRIRAGLDVTDPEPLPASDPLWSAPGVLISPHVGGDTWAYLPRFRRLVSAQLRRWAAGEPLENVVDGAY